MSSSCAWATVASNKHAHAYVPHPLPPCSSTKNLLLPLLFASLLPKSSQQRQRESSREGGGQRGEKGGKRAPAASCVSDVSASISPKQIDKLDLDFVVVVVVVVSLRFSQGEEGLALKRKCNICWQRHANRFLNARVYSPRTLQCVPAMWGILVQQRVCVCNERR